MDRPRGHRIRRALLAGALVAVALGAAPAAAEGGGDGDGRIVNGKPARHQRWPFIVALLQPSVGNPYRAQFCDGTLVAPRVVVSAAHCFDGARRVDVLVGTGNLQEGGRRVRASWFRQHPGWDPFTAADDAAVVFLSRAVGARTLPLATNADREAWRTGALARVGGWGCSKFSAELWDCVQFPPRLRQADVQFRSRNLCGTHPAYRPGFMVCAGDFSMTGEAPGPCFGDSGGPLTVRGRGNRRVLAGIVSFGGGGCGETPAFYTRVASYTPWLTQFVDTQPDGYWAAGADGGVFAYGDARYFGGAAGEDLAAPVVDLVPTVDRRGYTLLGADGGVLNFGNAPFHGGLAGIDIRGEAVGLARTPEGDGYWIATSAGPVFAFGAAEFLGNPHGLDAPVVDIVADPTGEGYWLLTADGAVIAHGTALDRGGADRYDLAAPAVALAATPSGRGYWVATADGGVFAFGDAGYHGGLAGTPLAAPIVDLVPTPTGDGYWLIGADGGVFAKGDARFLGAPAQHALAAPITGAAAA